MNEIDNGGPAFPLTEDAVNHKNKDFDMQGMTLRNYFAAKVLQGLISLDHGGHNLESTRHALAECAYGYADAMIQARKATP